jgi:hypothetical protein
MKKKLMGILYYKFLPKREIKKSPKIVTIAYSIEKVLKIFQLYILNIAIFG